MIADLNDSAGQKLAEELNSSETKVIYQRVNVTNEEDIAQMVERAVTEFGKLDIIFNNAGIGSTAPSIELSYED